MSYNQSPASQLAHQLFSGADKNINIVGLISLVNAAVIFGLLYYLEIENEGLASIIGFFMVWRSLALAGIAFHFRKNIKKDFAKFICVLNILVAISADYLIYEGSITDTGWEQVDEVIDGVKEKLGDNTPQSSASEIQPQPQAVAPETNLLNLKKAQPISQNIEAITTQQPTRPSRQLVPQQPQIQPEQQLAPKLREGFSIGN